MIDCKRTVKVMHVAKKSLRVSSVESDLCSVCSMSGRCRSDWLRAVDSQKTFDIPLEEPISVKEGEVVCVVLRNVTLHRLVVTQYGVPLVGLVSGIGFGQILVLSEVIQLCFGVCSMGIGWFLASRIQPRFSIEVIK